MKNHHEEIIYRALRGQATPEEEKMLAKWYSESPEECSREIEAIHSIIDLTGMSGLTAAGAASRANAKEVSGKKAAGRHIPMPTAEIKKNEAKE